MKTLWTTGDVIEALNGTAEFAKLFGFTASRVCNYRQRGRFPKETFIVIQRELKKRELRADLSLWSALPVEVFELGAA
jgi:hypothetical protein